jgi:hypothetical protein
VAVISRKAADDLFPGQDPIGRRVRVDGVRLVAGVVDDIRWSFETPTTVLVYLPLSQAPTFIGPFGAHFVARTHGEPLQPWRNVSRFWKARSRVIRAC